MEITFNLEPNVNRPIIQLDDIFKGCTALLDTGAVFPVWTKNVVLLQQLGAILYKKNLSFSGFGGLACGDVYKINLRFGEIYYPNMPIIAYPDNSIPGYFLFSATMFGKSRYIIDNITKKFILELKDNQVCYHLSIIDSEGRVKILINH